MKSFFQRFHDSQPAGASKSRTKDPAYKQWIPSKFDKDRPQLSDGVEPHTTSSSKRPATKSAGLWPPDVPAPGALGRATTDHTTRYSTIPGPSISRHLPPSLPFSKTHPPGPSTSKAPNLKPPDEAREKSKPLTKRNEVAETSGNEKDATARVKSERPSRSGQIPEPSAPQQHQIWRPSDMKVSITEKEKKRERQRQGEETPVDDNRPLQEYDPDRKNERPDGYWTDRVEGSDPPKIESKERDRGTKERHRGQAAGGRKTEQWEQQERDVYQVRERETREIERLKERKEKGREKVREGKKEREKGSKREREAQRETEIDRDRVEERDKRTAEGRDKDGGKEKEARERQDRGLQAKEQQEKERKERKIKERQIEKERWEREQFERMRRESEKEKERLQRKQKERERLQQERWEREQEEIERRELERMERERLKEQGDVRRKEQESRRRGFDSTTLDLLQIERERQEQRKRERELWEQQRVREREERERRRRGDRFPENPVPVPVDARISDLNAPRPKGRIRKEGTSDSEREQGKVREPDRRRTSRMLTQLDTPPPKPDHRNVPDTDAPRPSEYSTKTRALKQSVFTNGVDDQGANRQHSKSATRDEGYSSERNQSTQNSPDPPGRSVPPGTSPTQQVRLPSPSVNAPQFLNPPEHVIATQNQRLDSITPTGHSYSTQNSTRAMFPDTSNQVRQSPKEVVELANRPIVPFSQAQSSIRQAHPTAPTGQAYDSSHTSSHPAPVPTEVTNHPSPGPPATDVLPAPPVHTRTSQENRPFPSAAALQAPHSSALPSSQVPLNIPDQPNFPPKETHPPNVPTISISQNGLAVVPIAVSKSSRSAAQISLESFVPESRTFPAGHRLDPNALSASSAHGHHTSVAIPPQTAVPSVHGISLSSSGQQNNQTNTTSKQSPAHNPSNLNTNSGHPSTANVAHDTKESSRLYNFRKNESVRQMPFTQPVLPLASVTTTSRPVAMNKRSNTVPPHESYSSLTPPSADPKVINTTRPSPTYHVVKIQDTVPPTDITNILQPNKTDPRLRISPHDDKISLQESTPPTSRQYLTDNSDYHNRMDQPPRPVLPPALAAENRNIASENKQRDYNLARTFPPPPIDNQDAMHPRHQRHYSEGEVARHRGKPSPKSQPTEDVQVPRATQVLPVGSKSKAAQPPNVEPDANPKVSNIAFRIPVIGGVTTDRKNPEISETRPSAAEMLQGPGVRLPQSSQGPNTTGVSHLVSHYERIEQTAQLGGTILRPATTVPRDTARATPHEPLSQIVSPISHSLSASVPPIERPRTSNGVRPSTLNPQPTTSRADRSSRLDTSLAQQPPAIKATAVEPRHDPVPYQMTGDGHPVLKTSRPNLVAQNVSRPSTANGNHGMAHRPRPDVPTLSHKVSYSEGVTVNRSKGVFKTATESINDPPRLPPPNEATKGTDRVQPQRTVMLPIYEDKVQTHQHPHAKEELRYHSAYTAPSQVRDDPIVRRDDTGNSIRDHATSHSSPTPSRQRKESSPHVYPDDNITKEPVAGETSIEDPRAIQHRSNHAYGHSRGAAPIVDGHHNSQRTEPVQVEVNRSVPALPRRNITETNTTTSQHVSSAQHLPFDERSRPKISQGSHSPHPPQPSPVSINTASISPQRTGNSGYLELEEEGNRLRKQRSTVHVKDPRLADLLSPPKANDAVNHSNLRDVHRTLAPKSEREPNVSPNLVPNNSIGGPETALRLRSSSGRGEHSPRNTGVDSSPSGPPNTSPPYTQYPDSSTRNYSYVRHSPDVSQHTPSSRSRPLPAEGHVGSQPEVQYGEDLRYGLGHPTSRQPPTRERAQDRVPNTEDVYSRKHGQIAPSTTRGVNARVGDTIRISHIPSNTIPYTSEQRGGAEPQRAGPQRNTYDVPQSVPVGNSRTRSESRNAQDTSVSYSRHPYTTSRETYNTTSSQTQALPHVSASNHVPSAPTIPVFGPSPDQMQNSRSSTQQVPALREETPTPSQPVQPPSMKPTPSKRNDIAPLLPETQNSTSSAPQPLTPTAYQIWLPPSSSVDDHGPSRPIAAVSSRREREREREREQRRDQDYMRRRSTAQHALREVSLIPPQPSAPDPRTTKPYHYLKTRKIRTMSLASVEAQDGAASTVIGSPTTSILSQAPIYIPPEQDPITAARDWIEAGAILPGQKIRRPGLVWADLDDAPPVQQAEHRRPEPRSSRSRRSRLSSSRSREASDTDQPSS